MLLNKVLVLFATIVVHVCLADICEVSQDGIYMRCKYVERIPYGDDLLEVIQLKYSRIERLGPYDFLFCDFINLSAMILRDTKLRSIESKTFHKFSRLLVLDLSENRLEDLPPDAFAGLDFLLFLRISGNRLESFDTNVFNELTNLEVLDLSDNRLKRMPEFSVSRLHHLRHLDLSNNIQLGVNGVPIVFSKSLQVLRMAGINLENFSKDFFMGLSLLQVLDLSNNYLLYFPERLENSDSVRCLIISRNKNSVDGFLRLFKRLEKIVRDVQGRDFMANHMSFSQLMKMTVYDDVLEAIDFYKYPVGWVDEGIRKSRERMMLIQRGLLFLLLAYMSFMFIACISKVFFGVSLLRL